MESRVPVPLHLHDLLLAYIGERRADQADLQALREAFRTHGPPDHEDFAAAWRAAGKRFQRAAAAAEPLKRLLDLAYGERLEALAESQDARLARSEAHLESFLEHQGSPAPWPPPEAQRTRATGCSPVWNANTGQRPRRASPPCRPGPPPPYAQTTTTRTPASSNSSMRPRSSQGSSLLGSKITRYPRSRLKRWA